MSTSILFLNTTTYHYFSAADAPTVTLKMGPNLNPNDIKVGDDVYYECHVNANPKHYKLAWFHDVSPEDHSPLSSQ